MTTLSILFIGLLLGMQHATAADHLAAGMAFLSLVIAVPLRLSARLTHAHRWLTASVGLFTCSLGLSVISEAGSLKALLPARSSHSCNVWARCA